ncbi:MAG: TonB-dependent receptor [Prolixibacteraceae bacterium]|jgi:TonB-linked SusC/RagA family outer membrane protein|nr:TonB-dependent receptor [Prolixibacteraceae bacterium]
MKKKVLDHASGKTFPKAVKIVLKMKLTLCIMLFSVLGVIASDSYSQSTKLSIGLKNATVRDALEAIENQSEYYFLYSEKIIDVSRKVNIELQQSTIEKALDKIFADTDVIYSVKGRQIILTVHGANNLGKPSDGGQPKTVSGKVTDSLGQPLPGVSVVLKGTITGTITDFDGKYTLANVPGDATLVFSFVGMRSQEVLVAGKSSVNVSMADETIGIEEVVAVGYGTQRRDLVTNAISSVKIDDTNFRVSSLSPSQLLQGRVAGVNMLSGSGNLGSRERVSIRGASSLSASNEPLYVVDGIPITNSNGNLYDFGETMSSLSSLNLSDIESIDILKDAASAAIYGSRATNGVVLITTKSGKSGKTEVKVNLSTGFSEFPNKNRVKYADSELYVEQYNEGVDNYNRQYGLKIGDPNYLVHISNPHPTIPDPDWLGLITQVGQHYNASASFSGGTQKTKFYIGLAYNNQEGIIKTNAIEKISLSAKISHEMTSWLEVGTNITGSYIRNQQVPGVNSGATILARAVQKRPFDLPYKPNGEYYIGGTDELAYHNPLQILNEEKKYIDNYRYLGSFYAMLKFFKNKVTLKSSFYPDMGYTYDYVYYNEKHPYGLGVGRIIDNNRFTSNTTFDNVLDYNDKFGDLNVSAMLGHSFQEIKSRTSMIDGNGFPSPAFDVIGVAAQIANTNGSLSEFAMESYFGRASLHYRDKYTLNATIRTDGSSKFAPDVRWGVFPSVSLGWDISDEEFFRIPDTDLKFRLSYGKTGNQESISNYASLPLMSGGLNYGYKVGIGVTSFGNNTLTWETANQYNAGFDLSLKKGRINIIFDIYQKNTDNLLYDKPMPATTGTTSIISNIGSMRNRGIEFTLNTYANIGKVQWNSQFNISTNQNELTSLLGEDLIAIGANRALQVGKDIGIFYLYKMEGIYQYDGEVPNEQYNIGVRAGDVKWLDVDGNGIINDNDRVVMPSSNPKFSGGWNNTFKYRNFQLDIFASYMYGNHVYSEWQQTSLARIGYLAGALEDIVKNRWTGPGSTTKFPRAINGAARSGYSTMNSDRFLEDGSFIRLRSVTLSYNYTGSLLSKLNMKSLRMYCQADNLLLLTKYSGYDPEVSSDLDPSKFGMDRFNIPAPRTISFGVNVGF